MTQAERFILMETPSLVWPPDLQPPSTYFRLFIAADTTSTRTEMISRFAEEALSRGMVYCCAWGPGCEKVHDTVDDAVVASEALRERFPLGTSGDTVMTTWHADEKLTDGLEFFVWNSCPTVSYINESNVWLVLSVANSTWSATIREYFQKLGKVLEEPH